MSRRVDVGTVGRYELRALAIAARRFVAAMDANAQHTKAAQRRLSRTISELIGEAVTVAAKALTENPARRASSRRGSDTP